MYSPRNFIDRVKTVMAENKNGRKAPSRERKKRGKTESDKTRPMDETEKRRSLLSHVQLYERRMKDRTTVVDVWAVRTSTKTDRHGQDLRRSRPMSVNKPFPTKTNTVPLCWRGSRYTSRACRASGGCTKLSGSAQAPAWGNACFI